jgi:hypothetical protein
MYRYHLVVVYDFSVEDNLFGNIFLSGGIFCVYIVPRDVILQDEYSAG